MQSNEHAQRQISSFNEAYYVDPATGELWAIFDDAVHTRIGLNKIRMKSIDYTTGFQIEVTSNVIYKGLKKELFQTTKNAKANEVWIDNVSAFNAFCVGFDLTPSTSELLSETKYLDSYIGEDSALRKVIQELMKWTPESTRRLLYASEDDVMDHFEKECNLFNAHSYINFVTGFELTNKLYARFVQDKELNIRNFEKTGRFQP